MRRYLLDVFFVAVFILFLWLIKVDFRSGLIWATVFVPCLAILLAGGIRLYKNKGNEDFNYNKLLLILVIVVIVAVVFVLIESKAFQSNVKKAKADSTQVEPLPK